MRFKLIFSLNGHFVTSFFFSSIKICAQIIEREREKNWLSTFRIYRGHDSGFDWIGSITFHQRYNFYFHSSNKFWFHIDFAKLWIKNEEKIIQYNLVTNIRAYVRKFSQKGKISWNNRGGTKLVHGWKRKGRRGGGEEGRRPLCNFVFLVSGLPARPLNE